MARQKKVDMENKENMPTEQLEEIKVVDPKTNEQEVIKVSAPIPTRKEVSQAKLNALIAEETRKVKGRFRNYETPGASQRIQVRKYPGIPPFDMMMDDNKIYEIPLYVARHLNGIDKSASGCNGQIHSCSWPTHGFKWDNDKPMPVSRLDDQGIPVPIIGITKWNRRYGFESMEFDVES